MNGSIHLAHRRLLLAILAATGVALLALAPAAANANGSVHDEADELRGRWHFDEGSGSTAADTSGGGSDATLLGTARWTEGHSGAALALDGQGSAHAPAGTNLEPQVLSMEAWVRAPAVPGGELAMPRGELIIVAEGFACTHSYGFFTESASGIGNRVAFGVFGQNGEPYAKVSDASVFDGTWHHLAGTFDGTSSRLYVDGVLVGTETRPSPTQIYYHLGTPSSLYIGGWDSTSCWSKPVRFRGDIDHVSVWGRVMSGTEIAERAAGLTMADQEIEFDALPTRTYGDPPFALAATATSGLPVTFQVSGQCTLTDDVVTIGDAGTCAVTARQDGNADFNPAQPATQTFEILPASLSITATDETRVLGAPAETHDPLYAGFVNGEGPDALTGSLVVDTIGDVSTSQPGTYPLRPSGLTSPNYDITFVDGTLTTRFRICLLYDPLRPMGGNIPIKFWLCNTSGQNLSSSAITVEAVSLSRGNTQIASLAAAFRFDPKLRLGGGYQYDVSAKKLGLSAGSYTLSFRVLSDPGGTHQSASFVVK